MQSGLRLLKLITGETVMADVDFDEQKKHAILKKPLTFSVLNKSDGSVSMMATRWVESAFDTHRIKTYYIIANVAPSESMEDLYTESIADLENNPYDHNSQEKSSIEDNEWDDFIDDMLDNDESTTVH